MSKGADPTAVYPVAHRRVHDMPAQYRPREMLDERGAENVPPEVLLAVVLRGGVRGCSVVEMSRTLLDHYGGLTEMAKASVADLASHRGMGPVKAQVLKAALALSGHLARENLAGRAPVRTPADAAAVLRMEARTREQESFWVLLLDTKHRLARPPLEISKGILDANLVHAREVFKEAVRSSCAAVILVHNHPSGETAPSAEDLRITRRLIEAGRLIEIEVLDHVILGRPPTPGGDDFCSLRESGLVDFGGS